MLEKFQAKNRIIKREREINIQAIVNNSSQTDHELAERIMQRIFARRRLLPVDEEASFTEQITLHLDKVLRFIKQNKTIEMILPAFPAKSPNRNKAIGHLPDYGEYLAIKNLVSLCREIKHVYAPGAKVIICSDGRVFADVIYVPDQHISEYRDELKAYTEQYKFDEIEFYNLENVFERINCYTTLREELMIGYGETLNNLRQRIKDTREASTMYKGVTKFMFEDYSGISAFSGLSRSAIQNKARQAAYRVIQRSNAWGKLLQQQFPDSLRLSIHPQYLISEKIGISLLTQNDVWTTPWHAVVVKDKQEIRLLPCSEAKKLNCVLVYNNGRPSHFETLHP